MLVRKNGQGRRKNTKVSLKAFWKIQNKEKSMFILKT